MTTSRPHISTNRPGPGLATPSGSHAMAMSTLVILLAITTSIQAESRHVVVDWSRAGHAAALADQTDHHPRRRTIRPDQGRRLGACLVRAARELLGVRVLAPVAHGHHAAVALNADVLASLRARVDRLDRASDHGPPLLAAARPDLLNIPPPVCG